MASIFSKIIAGEIPSYKCAESKDFYAFLDINPIVKGHVLVVPKQETDYIFDIDDKQLGDMMVFAKKVAKAIKECIPCKKVGVAVLGLEVNHAHIHLVPLNGEGDMDFKRAKLKLPAEEMQDIASRILTAYEINESRA